MWKDFPSEDEFKNNEETQRIWVQRIDNNEFGLDPLSHKIAKQRLLHRKTFKELAEELTEELGSEVSASFVKVSWKQMVNTLNELGGLEGNN